MDKLYIVIMHLRFLLDLHQYFPHFNHCLLLEKPQNIVLWLCAIKWSIVLWCGNRSLNPHFIQLYNFKTTKRTPISYLLQGWFINLPKLDFWNILPDILNAFKISCYFLAKLNSMKTTMFDNHTSVIQYNSTAQVRA